MSYLECRDLKKTYPDFTLDVGFSLEDRELLCVVGPSGSGKSTLLSLISGIDAPDAGSVVLDGRDITHLSIQKRGIGMVFQDFSLFPSMNVEMNIQYGMKDMDERSRQKRTAELLQMVGLAGYGKRKVFELSGGEAQRIALARAVAAKPRILLLDEPLSALDAPLRKHLRSVIREIHDTTGIAMLYVTHDRDEAFAIADRIMVMRGGRIECVGKPEKLYRRPDSLFTAFFTGEGSSIKMSQITGEPSGNMLFFRPEAVELEEPKDKEDYVVLAGASVQSIEYTGANYIVRLSFKDNAITAYSKDRPKEKELCLYIRRTALVELSR